MITMLLAVTALAGPSLTPPAGTALADPSRSAASQSSAVPVPSQPVPAANSLAAPPPSAVMPTQLISRHHATRPHRISPALRRVASANSAATLEPAPGGFVNAVQIYPFADGALFRLYASPERITDIALQPGEALISVASGDTVRWTIGDTTSGGGGSDAFAAYFALSPSLWRSGRAVFTEVAGFKRRLSAGGLKPRVFLGVSSLEGDPRSAPMSGWSHKDWADEIRYIQMVRNVNDMAELLRGFLASRGAPFQTRVFEGETHNSVPWTAVNPILSFALGTVPRRAGIEPRTPRRR